MNNSKNNISVSVIIPAYNYGRYLAECLDSVLAQTFNDWECIVVDNGSTDNTAEVTKQYTLRDKRISYHAIEPNGVSKARNKAVALSSGRYILPLDADDKFDPQYIAKAVKAIESDKEIKVVYCNAKLFGASEGEWVLPEFTLRDLLIENSIFCSGLYRRSDFDASGGYDENMKDGFEDWDFWIRLLKNGGKVHKIPEFLFWYRIKTGSRNSVLDEQKQLALRRKIYENHEALYRQLIDLPELVFENYRLSKENVSLLNSRDLKLGANLLAPLRFIKKLSSGKKK